MRLYAKKKVLSWTQDFSIMNERDEVVYTAKGQFDLLGRRKLRILDANGNELAFIKQRAAAFSTTMDVLVKGHETMTIRKKMLSFRPTFIIQGEDWIVRGNFLNYEYVIEDGNGRGIAEISKKFFSWSDTFGIDIIDERANVAHVIAVVMAIHTDMQNSSVAATSASV
ncbi:LURP-one-related/scramblase family protein [Macrococcoides caseolyticum]|uniref:LURP-one-related/scramblase family protein n=1 Tax=Macrococcoides caseolyticum TaxID=69966 RepID=UPI002278E8E3|nr:LURP-one-related family protein [Macrococcus caseolyticus]MCE4956597.1 LURP-one-related family protein [Macrococcus caseolyticus]